MGHLIYGTAPAIRIDDRGLEHLRAVMLTKLRRNESFGFNWDNEPDVHGDDALAKPGLHGTVWISSSSSLYFSFDERSDLPLNRKWLSQLADLANGTGGLRLIPEPSPSKGSNADS